MSPIRASQRARYPVDWPAISLQIRQVRSGGRCECPGRHLCGSRHHAVDGRCPARHGQAHPASGSVVVLTVAHLDHIPENVAPSNLMAACQACHLSLDQAHHSHIRAQARAGGTIPLPLDLPVEGPPR